MEKIIRADEIYHGKTSKISVKGKLIFEGIPRKMDVMRYHSLIVDNMSLPECLDVIGSTIDDNIIMAVNIKNMMFMDFNFIQNQFIHLKESIS